jgi:hypothetical protein
MALLTASQVHIDQALTNISVAFMQSDEGFVADRVFPVVPVQKQSDKYWIYTAADWYRSDSDLAPRAPRTKSTEIDFTLSTDSFFCDVYSRAHSFDMFTMSNEDAALNLRTQAPRFLTHRLKIAKEIQWASTFFAGGIWTTDWDGVAGTPSTNQVKQWSDYTASTPIVDITNMKRQMKLVSGGYTPNTMVMTQDVFDVLVNHPDILDRLNGGATVTNTALITQSKIAEVFGVERLLIMDAVYNSAKEGQTESNAFISTKKVALFYVPPSAGLMTPSAGYTFAWTGMDGASAYGIDVLRYSGDWLREQMIAEKIEVNMAYDHKIISAKMGGFIDSVIA